MRIVLILTVAAFVVGAVALLVWRPTTALALAMIGAAVSLWRMKRPVRTRAERPAPKSEPVAAPAPVIASPVIASPVIASPAVPAPTFPAPAENRPDPVLLERVRGAGWTIQPAARGAPWLVAVREDVRVALRPAPRGPRATAEDVAEALAAKTSEGAQYTAIICAQRPEDAVAAEAKLAQVHIVNLLRLEAYLTLASTFRPAAGPRPQAVEA